MAKATTTIHRLQLSEEEQRRRDLKEIETILIENKEALASFLQLLTEVDKRGGLEMASSLFSEGDRVLDVLVKAVDKPEAAAILKNGLLMAGTLGKLNAAELGPLVNTLNGVIKIASKVSQTTSITKGNGKGWMIAAGLAGAALISRKISR